MNGIADAGFGFGSPGGKLVQNLLHGFNSLICGCGISISTGIHREYSRGSG
jgi:hypothetical protein